MAVFLSNASYYILSRQPGKNEVEQGLTYYLKVR